ncbi:purine-nucleoside phosphorylase [Desulfatitalea alkaliphila]|uniref:Purine nucleoside phosphorylase n=1 Tax=Desulfatitalea alkaliphila TaxID=2929485 RepID=A0AA41UK15_9BACT|nr:purine-nucleoside phosphorylase [Desulfatitalea alkaliphila]MCJ8499906.1 purine-nucleoside phosphorylase [Desulfatitalea alkaliphila]
MTDNHADHNRQQALAAADFIAKQIGSAPRVAILAGTGLGDMIDQLEVQAQIDYRQIPHFPAATVQSHAGRWVAGNLNGLPVAVLQGRFHIYEGHTPKAVAFPVRVLQALGVSTLIVTNASGGLNPYYATGDIMLIRDHINLTGANPLVGANEDLWGPRFPDMTAAYAPDLRTMAMAEARAADIALQQGVYVGLKGPSLETPAEMRFLRAIGADAVGLSTVTEVIAAVHGGMQVMGLSAITNMCTPDQPAPSDVDSIIDAARATAPVLGRLIGAVLTRLADGALASGAEDVQGAP